MNLLGNQDQLKVKDHKHWLLQLTALPLWHFVTLQIFLQTDLQIVYLWQEKKVGKQITHIAWDLIHVPFNRPD